MKKLLEGFLNWVKGFDLGKFFKGLVNGDEKQAELLKENTIKSSEFVNNIRAWLMSPTMDIYTAVIPGEWDNELKESAKTFLDKVVGMYAPLINCMNEMTVGDQLMCIYGKLNEAGTLKVKGFWLELGTLAAMIFSDGKLDYGDAVTAGKFVWEKVTSKNKPK
jgi:hypothetical protein